MRLYFGNNILAESNSKEQDGGGSDDGESEPKPSDYINALVCGYVARASAARFYGSGMLSGECAIIPERPSALSFLRRTNHVGPHVHADASTGRENPAAHHCLCVYRGDVAHFW